MGEQVEDGRAHVADMTPSHTEHRPTLKPKKTMAKKKIKAKKTPQKKKSVAAKRAKRPKTIAEEIDAFDWRDVKKIRVGEGIVPGQSTNPPKT